MPVSGTDGAHTAIHAQGYVTADVADEEGLTKNVLSGTKFRKALRAGEDIPDWCAPAAAAAPHPPLARLPRRYARLLRSCSCTVCS